MTGGRVKHAAQEDQTVRAPALGRKLLGLSIAHRALSLACLLLIFPSVQMSSPFDSSSLLLTTPPPRSIGLSIFLQPLIRWDSVHFLEIASKGFSQEQLFAFQPGTPALLRLTGAGNPLSTHAEWNADRAVLITSVLAATASALSPWLLFWLTLRHTSSLRLSFLTGILSVFSPAPASLVTPSPEPFFSALVLLGLLALSPSTSGSPRKKSLSFGGSFLLAAFIFAVATFFRANGVLLIGFLAWYLWWDAASKPFSPLIRTALSTLIPLPALPLFLFQKWAYDLFCKDGSSTRRAWCVSAVPSIYTYVQKQYWNVGFLRYWELAQIPNFLLAAPVLALGLFGASQYCRGSERPIASVVLFRKANAISSTQGLRAFTYQAAPSLLPHLLHGLATAFVLLFFSHVQIALRFATSGGFPLFWWALASWVTAAAAGGEQPRLTVALAALIMWNALSLALYSGFYPPA